MVIELSAEEKASLAEAVRVEAYLIWRGEERACRKEDWRKAEQSFWSINREWSPTEAEISARAREIYEERKDRDKLLDYIRAERMVHERYLRNRRNRW